MEVTRFLSPPNIYQGEGATKSLLQAVFEEYPTAPLLFVVSKSVERTAYFQEECKPLIHGASNSVIHTLSGEPSPSTIDSLREEYSHIKGVIGIGGGSVMDSAKALSAALTMDLPVVHYLEGVGDKIPSGDRVLLWLVPTTPGTGSEATSNAVLSEVGEGGFKRSLRHPNYIPDIIALDPRWLEHTPPHIIGFCGMDALTQLIEAHVSTAATPLSLGYSGAGLGVIYPALKRSINQQGSMEDFFSLLYGAHCSGVALANAGLGVVHGAASTLGGVHDIPHGVLCGTLLLEATREIVSQLEDQSLGMCRYREVGYLLGCPTKEQGAEYLIQCLEELEKDLSLPTLETFGFSAQELEGLAKKTGVKNTPVSLTWETIFTIYTRRL